MNRGGSWNNNPENCRSTNRNNNTPTNRNNNLGFRLAISSLQLTGKSETSTEQMFVLSLMLKIEAKMPFLETVGTVVLVANVDGFRCSWADRVPFTFWNKAISDLKKIPNRHLLFVSDGTKSEYYTAGFDLTFSREFKYHLNYCWAAAPATNLYFNHILEYLSVPYGKHKLRYTTYHEESNPITQFNGLDGALAASIPTIFMYGVPLIYSGQEVGCPMYPNLNPQSFIDWNANPSMLKNYKDVMAFYTSSEAARKGSVSNFSNSAVVFFKKARDAEELLVMTNTHNVDVTFSIPLEFQVKHWVNALTNESITLSSELHLSPFQFLLLKNE